MYIIHNVCVNYVHIFIFYVLKLIKIKILEEVHYFFREKKLHGLVWSTSAMN